MHPNDTTDALPGLLRTALEALSETQREVVWLLKFEGYSVAEIARQTGRSTSAIKVTAHRSYRALRVLLGCR
jgi:RNA polymerase sigma factor (sigma-70 family)